MREIVLHPQARTPMTRFLAFLALSLVVLVVFMAAT